MDFDSAICLTGYGKFHYEALLVCAISIISVGFQNGLSAYVFPAAQCDLDLTSYEIGLLNVVFMIGGTLSCFLWGILADQIGRRKVLIVTHLVNACVTLILGVNDHVTSLFICRFLNGFFIGGPGSIIFSYIAEFQPPKYRSSVVCCCGLFFTLSWLFLPLLAWGILPLSINFQATKFLTLNPWRVFFLITSIPEIIVGFWFLRLPESPKFFMAKGNPQKSLMIMRKMFVLNTGSPAKDFSVKYLENSIKKDARLGCKIECKGKFARLFGEILSQISSMFRPPLLFVTLLTCTIMFANMFGMFGLGIWLPEVFIRFEKFQKMYPNETVSIKQLSMLTNIKNITETTDNCNASFDPSVIKNTVALGLTSLLANAISSYFAARTSVKTIPFVTMLIGGVSSGILYFLKSSTQNLVVSCLFQSSMVVANMTIGGIAVAMFPTSIGAMAICLVMCAGRIGAMAANFVFGYLMDDHVEIPIFVVAGIVFLGAILCLVVPSGSGDKNSKNADIDKIDSVIIAGSFKTKNSDISMICCNNLEQKLV